MQLYHSYSVFGKNCENNRWVPRPPHPGWIALPYIRHRSHLAGVSLTSGGNGQVVAENTVALEENSINCYRCAVHDVHEGSRHLILAAIFRSTYFHRTTKKNITQDINNTRSGISLSSL